MVYLLFVFGLILLIAGAEVLVRGASKLAAVVGMRPLVIGLTVVAFGTSSPEMAVSALAAFEGQAGANIAIGNVVGSNIFNVLFILGISAVIAPLAVAQKLVRVDVPIMIGLSITLLLLALDGIIGRLEGLLLFAGILAYTGFAIIQGRREGRPVSEEYAEAFGDPVPKRGIGVNIVYIVVGLGMLVLGSQWLVDGAVSIAETLGVSELLISATIVAAGTSLPEVATSILASVRGERDIAVGNVVGSNLFNLMAVLGLSALVAPEGINVPQAALAFDLPVMVGASIVCLPIFFTGFRIGRLEAFLFLCYYVGYVAYAIVAASEPELLPSFTVVATVVIPASVLVLLLAAVRELRVSA